MLTWYWGMWFQNYGASEQRMGHVVWNSAFYMDTVLCDIGYEAYIHARERVWGSLLEARAKRIQKGEMWKENDHPGCM